MGLKARVKATGKVVEVDECGQIFKNMRMDYMDMRGRCYSSEDLDFTDNTPFDYWTRLEHQAAIAAMQGLMSILPRYSSEDLDFTDNTPFDYWTRLEHQAAIAAMQGLMSILPQIGGIEGRSKQTEVIDITTSVAHALVEKYKKEERK